MVYPTQTLLPTIVWLYGLLNNLVHALSICFQNTPCKNKNKKEYVHANIALTFKPAAQVGTHVRI